MMFPLFTLERITISKLSPSFTSRGTGFALFSSDLMVQNSLYGFKATQIAKILKNG